jgi:hypothetical protein
LSQGALQAAANDAAVATVTQTYAETIAPVATRGDKAFKQVFAVVSDAHALTPKNVTLR